MIRKIAVLIVVLTLGCSLALWAGGGQETATQPAASQAMTTQGPEDWNAIYEGAKKEGTVVIYSLSSRIFDLAKAFEEKYPGVKVEATDMTGVEQLDKYTRELNAGVTNVDILFLANETDLRRDLLPKGLVRTYVPTTLLDGVKTADVIPAAFRDPLLVHSFESKVVFYNYETYPTAPVKTLWDLTGPEWKGRVQMKDPLLTEENMNFLQMVVEHSDDMAKAYQDEFGKPITLSPGVENAGYEFIYRLVKNGLVLTQSDGDASKAVGTAGQTNPPLALCTASSKIRDNTKGQKLAIAWDLKPVVGMTKANFMVVAKNNPHPNATKLLVQWMLGDSQGGAGFAPFNVPGQWSPRSDVKSQIEATINDLQTKTWFIDTDYVYEHGQAVRDFWISLE
jgi:iron(III) transport system substrate-binding protein